MVENCLSYSRQTCFWLRVYYGFGRHCSLSAASLLSQVSAFTNHTEASPLKRLPSFHPRSAISGAPPGRGHLLRGNRNGTQQFPEEQGSHQTGSTTFIKEDKQVSSWFPVEVIWDRREDFLPRRQASLGGKGVAMRLGGQSTANGVKIYNWCYMERITGFIYEHCE